MYNMTIPSDKYFLLSSMNYVYDFLKAIIENSNDIPDVYDQNKLK